jgi:hypothetical protein
LSEKKLQILSAQKSVMIIKLVNEARAITTLLRNTVLFLFDFLVMVGLVGTKMDGLPENTTVKKAETV